MNPIRQTTRAALTVLALAFALEAAATLPAPVLQALRDAGIPESAVGAVVEPVERGRALVSHRPHAALNPASSIKVLTSYAALDLLGPAFTFRTDLLVRGEIANGVLDGDLVVRGGGDPKLTYEKLWQIAHRLRARGLREIRGDLLLDRAYFAPAAHDAARFDRKPRRAYNVGADALLVNFNAIDFRFIPEGEGVRVTGEPDFPNVAIASRVRLVPGGCGAWRRGLQYEVQENGLLATVVFSGTYPAECGEKTWPLAVFDATRYMESAFRWLWAEAGGVLHGRVRAGATPSEARIVLRHESEPLAALVRDMNKFSNNVMARHVFLALSAQKTAAPGDAAASAALVHDWLAAKGVPAPGLVLENGSGLSRLERVSAATLAAALKSAWASPVMPELVASLPVAGVDGTLRERPVAGAAGRAHLKGGTLDEVQSLAGYVLDARGARWVVVMMVNHANANAAHNALDALVEWVYRREGR